MQVRQVLARARRLILTNPRPATVSPDTVNFVLLKQERIISAGIGPHRQLRHTGMELAEGYQAPRDRSRGSERIHVDVG